jgi:hypothetical protein
MAKIAKQRITAPALKTQYLKAITCLQILTLTACAIELQPALVLDRIKNRGPVGVSITNPYLVANKYLEYQKRNSAEISQFLKRRGYPAALEIQKPLLASSTVYLYYPENGEYFILEQESEQFQVTGPFKLSGRKMQQVREVSEGVVVR